VSVRVRVRVRVSESESKLRKERERRDPQIPFGCYMLSTLFIIKSSIMFNG
jgi:hypothetical protein